ncbi:hypothetical protein TNCV_2778421 [Trichonephila clavipes]|nr:hypothetical protein TNCV_2778421 [Trichonephila clavipes]
MMNFMGLDLAADQMALVTTTEEYRHLLQMMMIPAYNERGVLLLTRDGIPLQAKLRLLFSKKMHPCFTRDSNLNSLGYKPRVISTILAVRLYPL